MADAKGPSLADLRAELGTLLQRRQAREREAGTLGPCAVNLIDDWSIEAMFQEQQTKADDARIGEIEAAIAAHEAELPLSAERQRDIWRQVQERHRHPAQATP